MESAGDRERREQFELKLGKTRWVAKEGLQANLDRMHQQGIVTGLHFNVPVTKINLRQLDYVVRTQLREQGIDMWYHSLPVRLEQAISFNTYPESITIYKKWGVWTAADFDEMHLKEQEKKLLSTTPDICVTNAAKYGDYACIQINKRLELDLLPGGIGGTTVTH